MALEDYKDLVGGLASIVTICQFFSGVFICKDIVKRGNTQNVQLEPFIGGIGISVLFFKYANLINDPGMYFVNVMGCALNIGYLSCYYMFTDDKARVFQTLVKAMAFFGSILLYAQLENPEKILFRFGIIVTTLLLLLIALPMLQLGEVMRTKSTESLPFPMIFMGTISAFLWLLYGVIIQDSFVQFQNVVGFLLSAVQLSFFAIYPSKPASEKQKSS